MQTELFEQGSDSPILTVSEITREIRKSIESGFSQVWIRGEISNLRAPASGHFYFTLKDPKAQIKAVLFRGDAGGLPNLPQDGDECLVFGDLTVYEPRGDYQIRVRHLLQDGIGGLRAKFEALKQKLLHEGLFEDGRKLPLPLAPTKIGVVTSTNGAALQDFISILNRRDWRGSLLVFDSIVQGLDAPPALRHAIMRAKEIPAIELIVITRGGGSLEDLWAFNDESLVRLISECKIPVISAVGHQTDFVLSDFVADLRAETPSAAAEWISTRFLQFKENLNDLSSGITQAAKYVITRKNDHLELLEVRLERGSPLSQIEKQQQLLDEFENRLATTSRYLKQRMNDRLHSLSHRLSNCSLQSILNKGFAYLKKEDGGIVTSSKALQRKDQVLVVFKDGARKVEAQD